MIAYTTFAHQSSRVAGMFFAPSMPATAPCDRNPIKQLISLTQFLAWVESSLPRSWKEILKGPSRSTTTSVEENMDALDLNFRLNQFLDEMVKEDA